MFDQYSQSDPKFKAKIILFLMLSLSVLLVINLYRLQISDAEKYELMSNKNRIKVSSILPKRGRIITSDGKIVAGNVCKYKLVMEQCNEKIFRKNMELLERYIKLEDENRARIADLRKKGAFSIVIKDGLSWAEYCGASMILFRLNGVSVENVYARDYAASLEFSHVVGHVAKNKGAVQVLVGKTGIEAALDYRLIGEIGNVQTEVNSVGKKVRIIDSLDPVDGSDVVISIDSRLQKYAYDLLSQEKAGACVVLDISNGEVLAMTSVPAFDPNLLSNKMTQSQWQSISNDPLCPLLNRAVDCSYPPGSIFKIIVAFAALSEGVISPQDKIFCGGGVKLDDRVFHCWNRGGHGHINLCDALSLSCDCYFFEAAKRLGIDTIVKYAKKFGFGSESGLELLSENAGLLPTKEWKFLKRGTSWKPYETMIAGIGQGALLATLTQSVVMFGKLYAGNYNFSPTLIKGEKKNAVKKPINSEYLEIIKKALLQVCVSGTASGSCRTNYGISGKTGSSQVRRIRSDEAGADQKLVQWKLRDHAFFVGCAPNKNPRYAVAVLVEHGGGGAAVAAPIARKIFDRLMKNE